MDGGGSMKNLAYAVVFSTFLVGSGHAFAQSTSSPGADIITQRLDALDKRNAQLANENAALRDRVRVLELRKRDAVSVATVPTKPTAAMAMVTTPEPAAGIYKAPPVVLSSGYNWTGFYVGGHFGGGLARSEWADNSPIFCISLPCAPTDAGSHNATGVLGGGQAGYNWQAGRLVFGVEGQYSFANVNGNHQNNAVAAAPFLGPNSFVTFNAVDRLTTKIDGIGTIAGRIGFASESLDRTLFFVKGGAAFMRARYSDQFSGAGTLCANGGGSFSCVFISENGTFGGSESRWGWMTGVGLEYGLTQNLSASIEYDFLGLGTKTVNLPGTSCTTTTFGGALDTNCSAVARPFGINQNLQLLKFGVNYRFN